MLNGAGLWVRVELYVARVCPRWRSGPVFGEPGLPGGGEPGGLKGSPGPPGTGPERQRGYTKHTKPGQPYCILPHRMPE